MSSKCKGFSRTFRTILFGAAAFSTARGLAVEAAAVDASLPAERAIEIVSVPASELRSLWGCPVERVVAWSCNRSCEPILLQVDERDGAGRWVLDVGVDDAEEEQRGRLDETDWVFVPLTDLGERLPAAPRGATYIVQVSDLGATLTRWFYLGCLADETLSPKRFPPRVRVEPHLDRVRMHRITIGFAGAIPNRLFLGNGSNLLDRVKLRAQARFLFGLLEVRRNETNLQGRVLGWRIGPLRAIRAQEQWVYLGWGIRTPVFRSYATFYPDYLDIPVVLRLRFAATHFFSDIRIQGYVDFRDLTGWSLLLPEDSLNDAIDGHTSPEEAALSERDPAWFALRSEQLTLVQFFGLSPSLQTVKRRFLYRDNAFAPFPPESARGEVPGVGYELTEWQRVGAGIHSLHAMSFVVPNTVEPAKLMTAQRQPLSVHVQLVP